MMSINYSHGDSKGKRFDSKLDLLFKNKENGFYIELGANDGLTQSNSAFFEKHRNWTGILIEPSVKGYELCKLNRPNSICLNYACVSNDFKDDIISGDFTDNNLMASINGKRLNRHNLIKVPTVTLEKILDKHLGSKNIDFLSLDTEGYELNILNGLNLDKYRPNYMLIEIYSYDYEKICNLLVSKNYSLIENFSNYNKKDNPGWDGTHNDYLFVDKFL